MLSMRTLELDRFVLVRETYRVCGLERGKSGLAARSHGTRFCQVRAFRGLFERNSLNPSIRAVLYRMKSVDGLTPEDIGYINDLIYGKVYLESLFRSRNKRASTGKPG